MAGKKRRSRLPRPLSPLSQAFLEDAGVQQERADDRGPGLALASCLAFLLVVLPVFCGRMAY